jgi:CheY-like chemotaxis protein
MFTTFRRRTPDAPMSTPVDHRSSWSTQPTLEAGTQHPFPLSSRFAEDQDSVQDGTIRILLVDDYPEIRYMTRRLLARHPGMIVVGEAGNGAEALDLVRQVQPDVVLMDVYMPILDGVAATKQLRSVYPDLPIVLFTSCDHDGYVLEGVRAGAAGYLLKDVRTQVLVSTLRAVTEDGGAREPARAGMNTPHPVMATLVQ